jgi:dephospho-CoA kinase
VKHCFGLTGGIGSGKSTVAQIFAELGARIVDTDLISHQLTQSHGLAIPAILNIFGSEFIDSEGALDRNKMRDLVFADDNAKKDLEAILHPLILEKTKEHAFSETKAPYTLVIVPLLYESQRYRDWLLRVIVVDCTEEQQIKRTMLRSGMSEPSVRAIMGQQLDRTRRLQLADDIIINHGDMAILRNQVSQLHNRLINL